MRLIHGVSLAFAATLVSACSGGGGPASTPPTAGTPPGGTTSVSGNGIPTQYTLTDLGTGVPGSPGLVASAINDNGDVAGNASAGILSSLPGCAPCGPPVAWVYRNGALHVLPPLGSDTQTFADDINNAGVVSGGSTSATTPERAVLWNPDGSIVNLGLGALGANSNAEATAISNSGKIIGYSFTATTTIPTVFDGKGGASDPCGSGIQGYFRSSINDNGVGVGDELLSAGGTAAMTCPPFTVIAAPSNPAWLNFGFGINNAGDVVGRLSVGPTKKTFHPFLFHNGVLTDLGTPLFPGNSTAVGAAFGINNEGTVVGWEAAGGGVIGPPVVPPDNPRAFVYSQGKMIDLNTLLPASCSQWKLVVANRINNRGQIVGEGFVGGYPNGVEHAFLLTPQ